MTSMITHSKVDFTSPSGDFIVIYIIQEFGKI